VSDRPILPYETRPAAVYAWDPRTVNVALRVAQLVAAALPGVRVEHVGSSAVPGLPGKGIVDLAIEASPDAIPGLTRSLESLGFCRQDGIAAFPPARPLLLGAMWLDGADFRIHLHVIPPGRGEIAEMRGFRDALREDAGLRAAYLATKQAIVDDAPAGDANLRYTIRKGSFVEDALYRLGLRRAPADGPVPLAPGATIGVLGGGQLGRMLGYAARAMGYGIVVLDPDPRCPSAAIADGVVVGRYDDAAAALELAERADVVTYELEHVAEVAVAGVAGQVPVRPGLTALRVTQDRLAERRFIRDIGEWTAPWREVRGAAETSAAAEALGYPLRLKAAIGGYDGRSQVRITAPAEVAAAVTALGGDDGRPLLLESEIPFAAELSVVIARGADGRTRAYPVARNVHDQGILVESVAPAPLDDRIAADACEIADSIARAVDLVGVLTVELFLLEDGRLMINELAPRVHNSGHWTMEGAATSQFEQHLRAILGLPLGSVAPRGAAAMVNLLGTGPDRPARLAGMERALADDGVHVHVYGKRRVFERRKMGHVTVVADTVEEALARARTARAALTWED
jgi:5-(carboxyamino)imidazole ribonucleotide synthase